MDKLKVLLIMLLAATSGLAISMYILALSLAPTESPLSVLAQILTRGFSPDLPFFIPLSSLLFLQHRPRQHGGRHLLPRAPRDEELRIGQWERHHLGSPENSQARGEESSWRARRPRGHLPAEVHHERGRSIKTEDT